MAMKALALFQQLLQSRLCRCMVVVIGCCELPPSPSLSSHPGCGGSEGQWLERTKAVTRPGAAHEYGRCCGIHMSTWLAMGSSSEVVMFVFEPWFRW
jgi:hypothetical protein